MTRAQDESGFSSMNIVCTRVNLSADLIICKTIHLSGKEQTEMQLHLSNQEMHPWFDCGFKSILGGKSTISDLQERQLCILYYL